MVAKTSWDVHGKKETIIHKSKKERRNKQI